MEVFIHWFLLGLMVISAFSFIKRGLKVLTIIAICGIVICAYLVYTGSLFGFVSPFV